MTGGVMAHVLLLAFTSILLAQSPVLACWNHGMAPRPGGRVTPAKLRRVIRGIRQSHVLRALRYEYCTHVGCRRAGRRPCRAGRKPSGKHRRPVMSQPKDKRPAYRLGQQLKRLRIAAGYTTQAALAARAGYGEDSISKVESGDRVPSEGLFPAWL